MNRSDLLRHIQDHMPKPLHHQAVYIALALTCNDQCVTAMSYAELSDRTNIHEKSVRLAVRQLVENGFLRNMPDGSYQVCLARARGFNKPTSKDITTSIKQEGSPLKGGCAPARDLEEPRGYRSHMGSSSEPSGTGARASLGKENCPHCGGTGWMEVEPASKTKAITVDVCICRGGKFNYVQVNDEKEQFLSARQRSVNDDGFKSVKEVLGDAAEAYEDKHWRMAENAGEDP